MGAVIVDLDSLPRRVARATLLVTGFLLLPAVVGALLGGTVGAVGTALGMVGALVVELSGEPPRVRRALPLAAVAFALGGLSRGTGWWVLVAAGFGALAGAARRWHLMSACAFAAIVAVTAPSLDGIDDALLGALFVLGGASVGTALARRVIERRVPAVPEPEPAPRSVGALGAIALGSAAGVAAWIGHRSGDDLAHWIPMTVVLLALPAAEGRDRHVWNRALGTLLGLTALVPLGHLAPSLLVTSLLALVCVVLVVAVDEPYWLQVTFVTILVVLAAAPLRPAAAVAERRALFTLVGALVVLAIGAVADRIPVGRRGSGHRDGSVIAGR